MSRGGAPARAAGGYGRVPVLHKMDADFLRSGLCRARELALSDAGCPALRAMLRALNPTREAVKSSCGARVPLRRASAAQLLAALESETGLALRRLPGGRCAYREAELAWHAVASSAACGALDLAGAEGAAAAVAAGLVAALGGGAFALLAHPGVYLLPRALALRQQEGLVRCALRGYIEPPNRRNIDAFSDPDASNIAWAAQHGQGEGGPAPPKRGAAAAIAAAGGFASGLWAAFVEGRPPPLALEALTWSTLGCQYDWTARAYHLPQDADFAAHQHGGGAGDRWRAPFPPPCTPCAPPLPRSCTRQCRAALPAGRWGGARQRTGACPSPSTPRQPLSMCTRARPSCGCPWGGTRTIWSAPCAGQCCPCPWAPLPCF